MIGLSGPDHALARRDGDGRRRDAAAEMKLPLLIGGATTSKAHTALRIDPAYAGPVIHVLDASRAVGVASSLVSDTQREPLIASTADDYDKLRKSRERSGQRICRPSRKRAPTHFPTILRARRRRPPIRGCTISAIGRCKDLKTSIDWTPFFRAWELAGTYPAILDDPVVGESARSLFKDAQADARPAHRRALGHAQGDRRPVALQARGRRRPRARRQRLDPRSDAPPAGEEARGPAEHVPCRFHLSRRRGLDRRLRASESTASSRTSSGSSRPSNDYDDILLKALADRLAESFAEVLHAEVRNRLWGYADEHLSNAAADPREISTAFGPRRAIPPVPTTASSRCCSRCSAAIRAKSR